MRSTRSPANSTGTSWCSFLFCTVYRFLTDPTLVSFVSLSSGYPLLGLTVALLIALRKRKGTWIWWRYPAWIIHQLTPSPRYSLVITPNPPRQQSRQSHLSNLQRSQVSKLISPSRPINMPSSALSFTLGKCHRRSNTRSRRVTSHSAVIFSLNGPVSAGKPSGPVSGLLAWSLLGESSRRRKEQ